MLAKSRKLNLSKPEVRRLVRTFYRLTTPHLLVKCIQADSPAAGLVVVSKQFDKRAVMRNEIRRFVYVQLEEMFNAFPQLQIVIWLHRATTKEVLLTELQQLATHLTR